MLDALFKMRKGFIQIGNLVGITVTQDQNRGFHFLRKEIGEGFVSVHIVFKAQEFFLVFGHF
ncbi:hypothetical protein D3C85_1661450 [compost metagenome]